MEDFILEYRVLDAIQQNEGNLTQRDISQKIGCSVASVNFAVRLLAVKGLIKISGSTPRRLHYHLTPRGLVEKSIVAFNFLKKQTALYHEARRGLLEQLEVLRRDGVKRAALYGWTPLTEACLLYLVSERIKPIALYVEAPGKLAHCNKVPVRCIDDFLNDVDALVLMEPLPENVAERVTVKIVQGFPAA